MTKKGHTQENRGWDYWRKHATDFVDNNAAQLRPRAYLLLVEPGLVEQKGKGYIEAFRRWIKLYKEWKDDGGRGEPPVELKAKKKQKKVTQTGDGGKIEQKEENPIVTEETKKGDKEKGMKRSTCSEGGGKKIVVAAKGRYDADDADDEKESDDEQESDNSSIEYVGTKIGNSKTDSEVLEVWTPSNGGGNGDSEARKVNDKRLLKNKRKDQERKRKADEALSLSSDVGPNDKLMEYPIKFPLTEEEIGRMASGMIEPIGRFGSGEVEAECFENNVIIKDNAMKSMKPGKFLNDDIVDFCLEW